MAAETFRREPGGFIPGGLPSPSPSAISSASGLLPHPRATALRSGGSKETALLNVIEGRLRNISARFERRFQNDQGSGEPEFDSSNPGYSNAANIVRDLEQIVDIIWVSGTPSLQIPFLINIGNALLDYLEPFPFAVEPTLKLFQKLDVAFSSLIHGEDVQTGERLPGFESGRKVNMTEKVRLRGLVERSRVMIVELAGKHDDVDESEAEFIDVTETEDTDAEDMDVDIDTRTGLRPGETDLDIARVYQRTLADLSDTLVSHTSRNHNGVTN